MAERKKQVGSETLPDLRPDRGLVLLRRQLEIGEALGKAGVVPSDEFSRWRNTTREFLARAFGSVSSNIKRFSSAGDPIMWSTGMDQSYYDRLSFDSLQGKLNIVRSCIDQLEAMIEFPQAGTKSQVFNHQVFIVHGRDERYREAVARLLEKLDLPVTILHEQPNKGRTIVEKFEDYSDIGFAVVLLTGDDKGGLATDSPKSYRPRARQNVILELGFFLAKVGRERVCALYEAGVDIPSDFSGVLFVELDSHRRWHVELAKELKAAGFDVDMNKVFETK